MCFPPCPVPVPPATGRARSYRAQPAGPDTAPGAAGVSARPAAPPPNEPHRRPNEDPEDGCPMNSTAHDLPTALATAGGSMADGNAPDARTVPSFSYARVAEALAAGTAGVAGAPHLLTIAAQ